MVRQTVFVLALFWCVLSVSQVWANPPKARELLARIQAYYEETHNFVAEFEQEVHWRRGNEVRLSKGKVYLQKPGLMRWEYTWPEELLIVADGLNVYIYSVQDKQVMVFPSGKALSPKTTLGFMTGKGNLQRDFDLLACEELPGGKMKLLLRPRLESSQVAKLALVVDPSTGAISEIWFWDHLGNLTKIRFFKVKRNLKLAPELFRFVPPEGVEIVRER